MYKAERTIELLEQFDKRFESHRGDMTLFARAVGAYFIGRRLGWKVLYIVYDSKTLKKYEGLLGIEFRKEFEEFEDRAPHTRAYKALKLITNFWKAVKGESDLDRAKLKNMK